MATLLLLFIVYAFIRYFMAQQPEEASMAYKLATLFEQVFVPALQSLASLLGRAKQAFANMQMRAKAETFYGSLLDGSTAQSKIARFRKALADVRKSDAALTIQQKDDTIDS